jgi:DNA-directed RNA polymerase subunit M/transcription elongation factor TFIIS
MKKFAKAKVNLKVNNPISLDESPPESPIENAAELAADDIEKAFSKALDLKPVQYKKLFELRYPSGELMITGVLPDMSDESIEITVSTNYEIIAMIREHGFDKVYDFLRGVKDYEQIVLDSEFMRDAEMVLDYERDLIRDIKHDMVESGIPCPKCKEQKVTMVTKQTRSADEPMTIFYTCFNARCNYQWHG